MMTLQKRDKTTRRIQRQLFPELRVRPRKKLRWKNATDIYDMSDLDLANALRQAHAIGQGSSFLGLLRQEWWRRHWARKNGRSPFLVQHQHPPYPRRHPVPSDVIMDTREECPF